MTYWLVSWVPPTQVLVYLVKGHLDMRTLKATWVMMMNTYELLLLPQASLAIAWSLPLGSDNHIFPSFCHLPKDSQSLPLASSALLKAKNQRIRSPGRMELRASHLLTWAQPSVLQTPWEPRSLGRLDRCSFSNIQWPSGPPKLPITRNQLVNEMPSFKTNH